MHDMLIRTYFFSELTMTRASYVNMLELNALPQSPPGTYLPTRLETASLQQHYDETHNACQMDWQKSASCLAS
jgi:hypothetical protein